MNPKKYVLTLVFVLEGDKVLLGQKKRGFGQGKWNGFGGKVEAGETITQAMLRELEEEAGLKHEHAAVELRGMLNFHLARGLHEVHVGVIQADSQQPVETEEMKPQWFSQQSLPLAEMWEDDAIWLARVLQGETVGGDFHFDANDRLVSFKMHC